MHSPIFISTPRGVERALLEELRGLGISQVKPVAAGVACTATLEQAYRACLWSRLASRVLLRLAEFPAADADALYAGVQSVDWSLHLGPQDTLAVDAHGRQPAIPHTHYAALKVKDAIVDQVRGRTGSRPSVNTERPDVRVHLHLARNAAMLYLDLSGDSLHRRGYRPAAAPAPLKENLAAAILWLACWPRIAGQGGAFHDPMCGSGTLAIEAAWMAADHAPGLLRKRFGFTGWRGHDEATWRRLLAEADERRAAGLAQLVPIIACDADAQAIAQARTSIERAGLEGRIELTQRRIEAGPPSLPAQGLIAVNPPYGERLGGDQSLPALYAALGRYLRECRGFAAAVFSADEQLEQRLGQRATRRDALYNGPIACTLARFPASDRAAAVAATPRIEATPEALQQAQAFANRLRKNQRHLSRYAARMRTDCYRVYDADLPEYALAVDRYGDWAVVQEYAAPKEIAAEKARERLAAALAVLPDVLDIPASQVICKERRRQNPESQYPRLAEEGRWIEVHEGDARFRANLSDYLDTGLFLDTRPLRALIHEQAKGRRFLNLFAYTATATVSAALGGAIASTSVDLSRTYTEWAARNLRLNGLDEARHHIEQADVLQWLRAARETYDLILLDPPTFSNSKRMRDTLDAQRDHIALIRDAVKRLTPSGILFFCTHQRRFQLDSEALADLHIEDLSRATLPEDFARDPHVHQCWRITATANASLPRTVEAPNNPPACGTHSPGANGAAIGAPEGANPKDGVSRRAGWV
jgi:23S rRNA (guanine2445-N2)-methyltransferase / 23S rRNA (guanine2069-N7)-methyltransferase